MLRRFISTLGLAFTTGLVCAQGVTDSQVLLGQSVALTGPAQQLGLDMQQGAKLYFDAVNSRGGVHGRKIVLKTLDDGYEATRAVENTKKLINEDRVFALFGKSQADALALRAQLDKALGGKVLGPAIWTGSKKNVAWAASRIGGTTPAGIASGKRTLLSCLP